MSKTFLSGRLRQAMLSWRWRFQRSKEKRTCSLFYSLNALSHTSKNFHCTPAKVLTGRTVFPYKRKITCSFLFCSSVRLKWLDWASFFSVSFTQLIQHKPWSRKLRTLKPWFFTNKQDVPFSTAGVHVIDSGNSAACKTVDVALCAFCAPSIIALWFQFHLQWHFFARSCLDKSQTISLQLAK